MQFPKFVERIDRIEDLIRKEATGTPQQLAAKIGISRRMLYNYLDYLKNEKGITIAYDRVGRTYRFSHSQCV